MSTGSDAGGNDVHDRLVGATLEVSRAHLMLSGTAEWAPPSLRPLTEEALATLEQALATLRSVAVQLDESDGTEPPIRRVV